MKKMRNFIKYISLFFAVSFFSVSALSNYLPISNVALAGDKEDFMEAFKGYGNGSGEVGDMVKTLEANGVLNSKDDSIMNVMYYLLSVGNYMNDVSKGVYGDDETVDKRVIQEVDGKKTICGNDTEPQNLLNHNCDIPSFGTELFQNIVSSWDTQGVLNAQRTTSVAGWGFGVPANIPNDTVPVSANERAYKYTALELYGYNLQTTSYIGEWDDIKVSSASRLLSNYGFFGKAKLTGASLLNGIGAGLDAAVSEFSWNPIEWVGNIIDSSASGVLWTIVDTSDMNVAVTHSWTRPSFSNTLYNAYYMSDEEVTEKGQAEFIKAVYLGLKQYASVYPELGELFALKLDDPNFPVFKYNRYALKTTDENGNKVYKTEEEQFTEWKATETVQGIINRGKAVGIDCDASTNYQNWKTCWGTEWDAYAKALISGGESSESGYVTGSDKLTNGAVKWASNAEFTIIGDSLTVGVQGYLLEYFPKANVNAKESRNLYNESVDETLDGYRTMLKMKEAGEIKDVVVIALGTNNGFTESQLKKFIDDLPSNVKKVVLVTTRSDVSVRKQVSERMKAVAKDNDKVIVLDWNAQADDWGWKDIVASDGIHLNNYQPYAQYLTQNLYEAVGKGSDKGITVSEQYQKIFTEISEFIQNNLLKSNKYLNPAQGISHYICADSEGVPTGATMADWKYIYTDFNNDDSENLNTDSACSEVRPSIEGALYGTGDNESTDTRYLTFVQYSDGLGNTSKMGTGWFGNFSTSLASFFTKCTNTLLSLSFSNILEQLGVTDIIESVIVSFRDGIFFPLVVIAIAISAVYTLAMSIRTGGIATLKTLAMLIGTFFIGVMLMFQPANLVKFSEEIPNKIDNFVANIILSPTTASEDTLCSATGGDSTGIRTMQCKVWEVGIFQPWTFSQFGTSWKNLDKDDMKNTNSSLVGNASVNMGANTIVKNWALYQLEVTKTGTITTYDTSKIDGEVSRNIYKLVDLQFGPDYAAKSDTTYSKQWAGFNNNRGTYAIKGALVSFALFVVIGSLSIAKIEMTVMFTIYLMLLPIMFLLGLFPGGSPKLKEYGMTMLNFYIKRVVLVLVISFLLNILSLVANSSSNYNVIAWFMIVFTFACKLYYKEIVNLFTVSTGSFSNAFGTQIGSVSKAIKDGAMLPPFLRREVAQRTQGLKEGTAGAAGGAIAGTLGMIKDAREGKVRRDINGDNLFVSSVKRGWQTGRTRGERFEFNKARRAGLGMFDTSLQVRREVMKQMSDDARSPESSLNANLKNMQAIVTHEKRALEGQLKNFTNRQEYKTFEKNKEIELVLENKINNETQELNALLLNDTRLFNNVSQHRNTSVDSKLQTVSNEYNMKLVQAEQLLKNHFESLDVSPENIKATLETISNLPIEKQKDVINDDDVFRAFRGLNQDLSVLKVKGTELFIEQQAILGQVSELDENTKAIKDKLANIDNLNNELGNLKAQNSTFNDSEIVNISDKLEKMKVVEFVLSDLNSSNYNIDNKDLNKALRSYKPGDTVIIDGQKVVLTESNAADIFIDRIYKNAVAKDLKEVNSRSHKIKSVISNVDDKLGLSESVDKTKDKFKQTKDSFVDEDYLRKGKSTTRLSDTAADLSKNLNVGKGIDEYSEKQKIILENNPELAEKAKKAQELKDNFTELGILYSNASELKGAGGTKTTFYEKNPKYTKKSVQNGFNKIFQTKKGK